MRCVLLCFRFIGCKNHFVISVSLLWAFWSLCKLQNSNGYCTQTKKYVIQSHELHEWTYSILWLLQLLLRVSFMPKCIINLSFQRQHQWWHSLSLCAPVSRKGHLRLNSDVVQVNLKTKKIKKSLLTNLLNRGFRHHFILKLQRPFGTCTHRHIVVSIYLFTYTNTSINVI